MLTTRSSSLSAGYLAGMLLAGLVSAQKGIAIGQPCNIERNRLSSTSHQFFSDCERKAYCHPTERVCKPKGCRKEEFPFGYRPEDTMPPQCPDGSFCPDEEDQCLPMLPLGELCQLNRDDQCQPPPNARELANDWNKNGAICLQFRCHWANATADQPCIVDNVPYIGFRSDGSEFATIISRDNCVAQSGLWCNAQTLKCERALEIGESCTADKMCKSHNCDVNNKCKEPEGSEWRIALWQYVATGIGIVAVIVGTLIGLFFVHKRQRAQTQREIREYYHEQTTYRNSILSLHAAARSSIYSRSESRFSQYDELGANYSDDGSHRHLLGPGASSDGGHRHSRLRESISFADRDGSDDEHDQGRRLLKDHQTFSQSRQSLSMDSDNDTPRQSFDYGQSSGNRGGYSAVPARQSIDLPTGAANPSHIPFKDPWSK